MLKDQFFSFQSIIGQNFFKIKKMNYKKSKIKTG